MNSVSYNELLELYSDIIGICGIVDIIEIYNVAQVSKTHITTIPSIQNRHQKLNKIEGEPFGSPFIFFKFSLYKCKSCGFKLYTIDENRDTSVSCSGLRRVFAMLDIYGHDDTGFEKFIEDAGIALVDPTPAKKPGYKFVDNVVPFPKHNRFGLSTRIHIFNELPMIKFDDEFRANMPKFIVREDGELDFWNEIRGYFVANEKGGVIVHDMPKFELPVEDGVRYIDATNRDLDSVTGWAYNPVVGDRIITSDYKVYVVIGFNCNDGATVYGDIR